MSALERVPAARLRPGDVLYACQETAVVQRLNVGREGVQLLLGARGHPSGSDRWFAVPHRTQFRRVLQSRRIEMGRKAKRGAK